jgi:DNA-binding NarL/FixJ family response regulator
MNDYFRRAKGLSLAEMVSVAALLPEMLQKTACNVLVLDDMLGKFSAAEWIKIIRADFPEIKIMVLTSNTNALYIQKLEKCGADAFVHNSTEGYEIKTGLIKMMQGIKFKCAVIAAAMANRMNDHPEGILYKNPHLCKREKEALRCMLQKMKVKEMMELLGIGKPTVKQYRSAVIQKIKAAGYDDIFDYARKTGMKK